MPWIKTKSLPLLLAVGLLLFCAACAVEAETPDALSLEERALAGEAVPVTEPCAVDLDGDGTRETVDFGDWALEPDGLAISKETWLRVGESEIPVYVIYAGDLFLFTPDGGTLLLAMRDEYDEYLYEYRDGALTEILPLDGSPLFHEWITGYDADTGCVTTTKAALVGTVRLEYRWQDKALLPVEQTFYTYYDYDSGASPATTLKEDFHFYTEPSRESEAVAVSKNTKIWMLGYQSDGWNKLEIESTGKQYWIDILPGDVCNDFDGTEISAYDLFGFLGPLP